MRFSEIADKIRAIELGYTEPQESASIAGMQMGFTPPYFANLNNKEPLTFYVEATMRSGTLRTYMIPINMTLPGFSLGGVAFTEYKKMESSADKLVYEDWDGYFRLTLVPDAKNAFKGTITPLDTSWTMDESSNQSEVLLRIESNPEYGLSGYVDSNAYEKDNASNGNYMIV